MRLPMPGMLGLALVGLSLVACESQEVGDTSRIFQAPAWTGFETMEYRLRERDDVRGFCTYVTDPGPQTTDLTTLCTDADGEGHRDDTGAVVNSQTLDPIASSRIVINQDRETRTERKGTYHPPDTVQVELTEIDLSGDDEPQHFETERDLPQPTESAPEPGWYDETSLFWLMRGIPLVEGFQGRYANVAIGTVTIVGADVEVEGMEEVTVPAGTFTTWSIKVESSITNRFWVDVDAPHRVVRARLEDTTFELMSWE